MQSTGDVQTLDFPSKSRVYNFHSSKALDIMYTVLIYKIKVFFFPINYTIWCKMENKVSYNCKNATLIQEQNLTSFHYNVIWDLKLQYMEMFLFL